MQRNSIVRLFVSKEFEAATSSTLKEKVFRMHGMYNSVFLLLHSVSPRKMYSCHEPIGKAFMKKKILKLQEIYPGNSEIIPKTVFI